MIVILNALSTRMHWKSTQLLLLLSGLLALNCDHKILICLSYQELDSLVDDIHLASLDRA